MNYILQKDNDETCELITLMNAYIHYNKCVDYPFPTAYGSLRYYNLMYPIFIENKEKFYNDSSAERIEYTGNQKNFKKWIDNNLNKGNLIDFGGYIREPHSFLIATHNKELDTYMCINARIFTKDNAVEWLPFPLLLKTYKKNIKYNNKSFNKLEINKLHRTSGVIMFK